ncbi:MAG: FHA domain-containing protein [Candidatus Thermoplasmatota archaeon]|nr:FHA domain-containing protein [Candidatus Thermoplasmatota archaeon]
MGDVQQVSGRSLDTLERDLKALSFANRLELLTQLREPKTLGDLVLTPAHEEEGGTRTLTRQAIRHHLDKLVEAGMVRSRSGKGKDGRTRLEYVMDEAQVYAVAEALRAISAQGPQGAHQPESTQDFQTPGATQGAWPDGPKLVLAHGAQDLKVFQLQREDLEPPRGWIVGRDANAHVRLPYDPFVSGQSVEIIPEQDGGYRMMDLRTARNRSAHNGEPLPVGGEVSIEHGDMLRVGSSLLVFHDH